MRKGPAQKTHEVIFRPTFQVQHIRPHECRTNPRAIPEAWPDDPKLKIFRELNKINRLPGYAGPPSAAATDAVNKFVLVDMFANAVTGKMKPEEAVAWATDQYKQSAAKVQG